MSALQRLRANLRLIWVITAKDVVDALKNKNALANLVSAVFIMVLYSALPSLRGEAPMVILYDQGDSALVEALDESDAVRLYMRESRRHVEGTVADMDEAALGLVLPIGFDDEVAAGGHVVLEGYLAYWVGEDKAEETVSAVESALSSLAGGTVQIETEGNTVQATLDSTGSALLLSMTVSIVVTMLGVTILPHLMIEEKQTKTIDLLLVSPASAGQVVLGKALTGLFYCLIPVAVIFGFYSTTILHWELAIAGAVLGSLFTVGVGLLLGSLLNQKQQLVLWGFVLMIVLLLPIMLAVMSELLPETLVEVLAWVPTTALGRVVTVSGALTATAADVGRELALLAGSATAVLAAVAWVVRRSDR